jgi:hypothetical protein
MKLIPLYSGRVGIYYDKRKLNGLFAIVDNEDYDWLMKKTENWFVLDGRYVGCNKGHQRFHRMHRLIMGATDPKIFVDHIDHNGFNNQKSNLRLCTNSQNCMNKIKNPNSTSKYKGVSLNKESKKWAAHITKDYKNYYIGLFDNEIGAALAYNKKAKELHGEFALLNIL